MENHHEQGKPRAVYETECRRLQHYRGYSVNKYGKVMLLIAAILILLMSGWLLLSDDSARAECEADCEATVERYKLHDNTFSGRANMVAECVKYTCEP